MMSCGIHDIPVPWHVRWHIIDYLWCKLLWALDIPWEVPMVHAMGFRGMPWHKTHGIVYPIGHPMGCLIIWNPRLIVPHGIPRRVPMEHPMEISHGISYGIPVLLDVPCEAFMGCVIGFWSKTMAYPMEHPLTNLMGCPMAYRYC